MMHHPNMHHQPMSGHPPQHLPGHQGMPGHHQIPPHQMHRENRHVPMPRVTMGPSAGGAMGGHAQALVGHPRPPHPARPMHHPPAPHHAPPPQQMKPMRRGYGGGFPVVYPPPPPPPPPLQPPQHTPRLAQPGRPTIVQTEKSAPPAARSPVMAAGVTPATPATLAAEPTPDESPGSPQPPPPPPPPALANSKEKTPMCLVNELARYNKTKHQYRLTSETGPAHKKIFTVTLRLGETEEYTAEGSSIKRAQHAAASAALAQTRLSAPPPRAHPAHPPHGAHPAHPGHPGHPGAHHRHAGSVMPTVELNALAMKLCQPAVYSSATGIAAPPRYPRPRAAFRLHAPYLHAYPHPHPHPHHPHPGIIYRSTVTVGSRTWSGTGVSPQGARHDAAARALQDLRPSVAASAPSAPSTADDALADDDTANVSAENGTDILNSDVKSPVSLIHELALKRNLTVVFAVKSERGPPHMRVFVTTCTVGDMQTEGEGNGKKVSKRRAAERMVEEMRRAWPAALLRARAVPPVRRKLATAKKKPRNLIKESGEAGGGGAGGGAGGAGESSAAASDNPISRLAMARHALRARSPQYCVVEERGAARRREFLVQCCAPPHRATGAGPNKKTAKRRAAVNVLLAMEMEGSGGGAEAAAGCSDGNTAGSDTKRKQDSEVPASGEARQPVPGVLMMDYHPRAPQTPAAPAATNGVSETSATGPATPGAKDQLMYLSQLLGFTVQFSDFPKRNHGSYLSLVSLSTEPPVMCHGGGASTLHSHEQCSRAALLALASMGLDVPAASSASSAPAAPSADAASLPGAGAAAAVTSLSNGVAE